MVIRRNDQRRRRVVLDEVKQKHDTPETAARKTTKKTKSKSTKAVNNRAYAFAADRRNQRKTTDLIPKRLLSFSLVVLTILVAIGGINLLAAFAGKWQALIGDAGVKAFSFSGSGSLSSWFSSFLLIITGMASLQIYALRQHRCDDYRGTYRLWLWMALLFVIASVHCVVNLGGVLGSVVAAITQKPVGDKVWALVTFKIVALTMLIVRGLFEVRESRGALFMVGIVWVAYSAAAVLQIPAVKNSLVVDFDVVYGNTILVAVSMQLLALFTYSRFIYLHAHGLISQALTGEEKVKAKAERKAEKAAAKEAAAADKLRVAEEKLKAAEEAAAEKQAAIELAAEEKEAAKQAKIDEKVAAKQAKIDEKAAAKQEKLDEKEKKAAEKLAAKAKAKSSRQSKSSSTEESSESEFEASTSEAARVPKPAKTRPPVPKPSGNKSASRDRSPDIVRMDEDEYSNLSKSERRRKNKLEKRARRAA